jgi:hypothetical protein
MKRFNILSTLCGLGFIFTACTHPQNPSQRGPASARGPGNMQSQNSDSGGSSLNLYNSGRFLESYEAFRLELASDELTDMQFEGGLSRLIDIYKEEPAKNEAEVLSLLKAAATQTRPSQQSERLQMEVQAVSDIADLPTSARALKLITMARKAGHDTSLIPNDQLRLSRLNWIQAYGAKKAKALRPAESSLIWLYVSGMAGYDAFMQGLDSLKLYITLCEAHSKAIECAHVKDARAKLILAKRANKY